MNEPPVFVQVCSQLCDPLSHSSISVKQCRNHWDMMWPNSTHAVRRYLIDVDLIDEMDTELLRINHCLMLLTRKPTAISGKSAL